ncbi:MAG: tRNA dimethylallyltransferase [Candidatus Woesebacteria bacterium GW2011_GWB1_45_5]|uniref:tRNA dimethylallyltransferase n=1 Tax=Candidatus Woesebacteria bacterium GW2011_GWB1_45_5 TaxID=1618581 RepID=A0A0G1MN05_9BACT|nr:MAG: tRNA dimethylallyltransferase [Candidatus Woesebacteria bacterium GW2011_GWB1_45_5]
MEKLLVICGPTATGKTPLAIKLAKRFNGEIVSADSRQVYKGMDIGTGKDLPVGAKIKYLWFGKYGYYEIDTVKVWGYDLADPRHEYSVAQYIKFAERIISDILKRGKLPILVGGTGLYIKAVVDGIPTVYIPRDNRLRKNFENRDVSGLFETLAQMDSIRAAQMNASDKKNSRRLVRAIEVATWRINNAEKGQRMEKRKKDFDVLMIGLMAPAVVVEERIGLRVRERMEKGILPEIKKLLKSGVGWDTQAMGSMGYGIWRDYVEGEVDEKNILGEWQREEVKYARRQTTWFRKEKRVNWFDITQRSNAPKVEKMVKKWHNTKYV